MVDKRTLQTGPWLIAADVDEKGDLTLVVLEDCSSETKLHATTRFKAETTGKAVGAFVFDATSRCGGKPETCVHQWIRFTQLYGPHKDLLVCARCDKQKWDSDFTPTTKMQTP